MDRLIELATFVTNLVIKIIWSILTFRTNSGFQIRVGVDSRSDDLRGFRKALKGMVDILKKVPGWEVKSVEEPYPDEDEIVFMVTVKCERTIGNWRKLLHTSNSFGQFTGNEAINWSKCHVLW